VEAPARDIDLDDGAGTLSSAASPPEAIMPSRTRRASSASCEGPIVSSVCEFAIAISGRVFRRSVL
jgi:hypothetical protein